MAESYLSKHHTGLIQCVLGLYCAVLSTVAYLHPRTEPAASSAGAIVPQSYSMPFWLWVGIIGLVLSVIIPAIRKLLARTPKSDSPAEVRKQVLGIASDLCGFLRQAGYPVEARQLTPYDRIGGHEDDSYGGLGDRKCDATIRDPFPGLFGARISRARELVGGLGLLDAKAGFTSVGDVLSSDVWNAGDVREIIDALENAACAISDKYIHGVRLQLVGILSIQQPVKISPPKLDGEIYRIVRSDKSAFTQLTRQLWESVNPDKEFKIDSDILVEMYVVNKSNERQHIRDLCGSVEIDGMHVQLVRENDFWAFDFQDEHWEYCLDPTPDEAPIIMDRRSETMTPLFIAFPSFLDPGQPAEGWVRFLLKETDPRKLEENRTYKFLLKDSLGTEYQISRPAGQPRTSVVKSHKKRA